MKLWQALAYFFREALVSLIRSWKVSLLAVFTISVSLFVGGILVLLTTNLATLVEQWRSQAKVLVYLEPGTSASEVADLKQEVGIKSWVLSSHHVDSTEAKQRFRDSFPSLSGMVEDWQEEPLPASLEISLDPATVDSGELEAWLETLQARQEVEMIDDDRDWLSQLSAVVALLRGVGLTLGTVLLGAAIFTIASVIRLTAYLYQDEIAIMRLVGATEFFIRGPFYAEGFLQGLLGGALALGGLLISHTLLRVSYASSVWGGVLLEEFLSPSHQLLLVLLGAISGLIGAVISLPRENLGSSSDSS